MNMNTLISLIILIIAIAAIVDIIKSNKDTGKKVIWIIVVIILPLLGSIVYYFAGRK